jgi:low affinity Fe/Cu permease
MPSIREAFRKFAYHTSRAAGTPVTFAVAAGVIVAWAVSGPLFGFSDTWQLIINTSTTIVTFLMVFLIQNTQNRDNEALHAKLDELIHVTTGADNTVMAAEDLSDEDLERLRAHFTEIAGGSNGKASSTQPRKRQQQARERKKPAGRR